MKRREMKLSTWARKEGIPLRTAQRMHQRGELPVPAKVTETGRIMVFVEEADLTPEELTELIHSLQKEVRDLRRRVEALERR